MDRKTKKILTMYGGLHPRSNVECLHLTKNEGGRGLVSRDDCVINERKSLAIYALGSNQNLINAATAELKLKKFINIQDRQEGRKERLVKWKERALHVLFLRETESIDYGNRWE